MSLIALEKTAKTYLEGAAAVSVAQFGEGATKEVPLLVVQIAQLMATLDQNRLLEEEE